MYKLHFNHVPDLRQLQFSVICTALLTMIAAESRGQDSGSTTQPTTEASQTGPFQFASSETQATLKKMSLDELLDVQVTSVSKRQSTIGESAAAVFVVTQDDIRRSGSTNIPEALRMVPGLEVAQIDSNSWGISARGFNSQDANKLLVLIDGRSVYTPLFGGVFWDAQDTMMQDVDRIEVIRGPAGALWGENAVNGVINVISKSAEDTQGVLLSGGGGSLDRDFGAARFGWKIGEGAYARIYVKHFEDWNTPLANGADGRDYRQMSQGGFRIDYQTTPADHFTFHGDSYSGYEDNLAGPDTELYGSNIVALWTHDAGDSGDTRLQFYDDYSSHNELPFTERRNTIDLDFQHHIHVGSIQDVTWGLGYRITADHINDSATISFDPDHRATQLISAFAQDEIQLVPDKLRLTLGSKFEHSDFSTFDVQPSGRLLWNITKKQSAWVAVSRAVRTPTRLDEDVEGVATLAPGAPPTIILTGNHDFKPENVVAYELGYRVEPVKFLSVDVASFYNVYDHLESTQPNITSLAQLPYVFGNSAHGDTYGVEVGSTLKATDWWTIRGAYTYLQTRIVADPGNQPVPQGLIAADNPENQIYVRSSMDLPHHIQLDVIARYVSELAVMGIPSYIALDVRVGWKPTDHLEFAVVGKNLTDNRHPEFHGNYSTAATLHEIPRSAFAMVTYQW